MKLCLFALTLLSATTLHAQTAGSWQGATPTPTPAATATPTPSATPRPASKLPPAEQIAAFLKGLEEGKIDEAYDTLLAGTQIARSSTDASMLKRKTREAFGVIGKVSGGELIDTAKVGENLERHTYLTLGAAYPLRWRFYFYKSEGYWRLIDIRISDRLVEMFGEEVPIPRQSGGGL